MVLSNSFFIRSLSHWNRLTDECRQLQDHSAFRVKVLDYLWSLVEKRISDINNNNPTSTLVDREPRLNKHILPNQFLII